MKHKEKIKILIKKADVKPRLGHKEHDQGCGYHDNRPKRQRTRQKQKEKWMKDY